MGEEPQSSFGPVRTLCTCCDRHGQIGNCIRMTHCSSARVPSLKLAKGWYTMSQTALRGVTWSWDKSTSWGSLLPAPLLILLLLLLLLPRTHPPGMQADWLSKFFQHAAAAAAVSGKSEWLAERAAPNISWVCSRKQSCIPQSRVQIGMEGQQLLFSMH